MTYDARGRQSSDVLIAVILVHFEDGGPSERAAFGGENSRGRARGSGLHAERKFETKTGGETGIRTLETVSRLHAFQACSLNHSDISPEKFAKGDSSRNSDSSASTSVVAAQASLPLRYAPVRSTAGILKVPVFLQARPRFAFILLALQHPVLQKLPGLIAQRFQGVDIEVFDRC